MYVISNTRCSFFKIGQSFIPLSLYFLFGCVIGYDTTDFTKLLLLSISMKYFVDVPGMTLNVLNRDSTDLSRH